MVFIVSFSLTARLLIGTRLPKSEFQTKLLRFGLRPTQMGDHPALLCTEVWSGRRKKKIGNPLQGKGRCQVP
jgi:hypothetical protein